MIVMTIEKYESIIDSFVDALNLRAFDNDQIHDHIESIDLHFNVVEYDDNNMFIAKIHIDNIECLYDAINDVIETIRIYRYVDMKYKNDQFVSFEYDDEIRIMRTSNDYKTQTQIDTITIETIDEFEKQNAL
jgi:hypothetical protein